MSAHPPVSAGALVALGGALIPDLDSRQFNLGRALALVSGPLEYRFGNRTLIRSLPDLDLTLQVRHPPGARVPELASLAPSTAELHPLLGKWVEQSHSR